MSRRTPGRREAPTVLGAWLVLALVLGALLTGCGGYAKSADGGARAQEEAAQETPGEMPEAKPDATASDSEASDEPGAAEVAAAAVDEPSIRESLDHLTGASPAPLPDGPTTIPDRGSEANRLATAEYLESSFEAVGVPARILEFTSDGRRGFNVEATLEGTLKETGDEKHLWITAHLDNVYNTGAEDNATGLVSVLMTAKALKQVDPEHTVHFVAFDLEEVGAVGSTLYAGSVVSDVREREGEEAVIGNLNSDMVGYDGGGNLEAVLGTCGRAGNLDDAVRRAAREIDSPLAVIDDCMGRSDHQSFWDAGLPAAVITDSAKYDGYPWYHDPADTPDKLDLPYLRSMIQLTAAATALLTAPEG